jgi:hypothetical protein
MFARLRSTLLVAMVATFAVTACGSDASDPTGTPSGSDKATLKLTNTSPNYITFIRTKSCGGASYGGDILGLNILGKNESKSWEFNPGCIDIRVTPAEVGADYLYLTGVQLEAGKTKSITISSFPAEASAR